MSAWAIASVICTLALGLVGLSIVRGDVETRLVAVSLSGTVGALDALAIAQSFGNESAFDVAALAALLSFPAGLVYARFYARWL